MNAILTLALKDLKVISRDKFALFWIFAFPLMYALFFGALLGVGDDREQSRIPIAIVDEDRSESSSALVDRLASHESLRVDRDGDVVVLESAEQARDDVQKGRKVAFLRIPEGFERDLPVLRSFVDGGGLQPGPAPGGPSR